LLSFLPRFGETPAYYVFECIACRALTWVRGDAPTAADERQSNSND
jgi:hypothetical protein